MADLVMSAAASAVARARADGSEEVRPDHLLRGALEAAATLGVAVFGPLVVDLNALPQGREPVAQAESGCGPRYAPETASLFDRAATLSRRDGEARVRLVHLLAAFGPEDSDLMRGLMEEHGFDSTAWRAALGEWDRSSNGATAREANPGRILSVEEAAGVMGVHEQTVRGYIRSGKLSAYRIAGERVIRIFASDLYDLLEPVAPDDGSGSPGGDRAAP